VSTRTYKRIAAVTLALLAAAQLAGCSSSNGNGTSKNYTPTPLPPPVSDGGGNTGGDAGSGGDGGDTGTPGALSQGVFVDAAVAGLTFTTSSDVNGVTDSEGRYQYRVGDTVTFSLGDLQLGTVPGQGIVTPKTVAEAIVGTTGASVENVAVNLLVLLQSLDADGDPDNGISFTPAIREAVAANTINLTASEAEFTSTLTTLVSTVSTAANVTLTPVTREAAREHFANQGPVALAGTYVRTDENFAPITQKAITLTLFKNGKYLLGGQHDSASCNLDSATPDNELAFSDALGNGIEHGNYTWDPLTNTFALGTMIRETDGYCGFNKPAEGATNDVGVLEATVDGLVFKKADGTVAYRFARVERGTGFGGSWLQPTSLFAGAPFMFTLFPSNEDETAGRYLMVDASEPSLEFDTSPGIEEGCYSVDANNDLTVQLDSAVCADAIDTNNTAGVSGDPTTLQLYIDDADQMVIADGVDLTGFARMPLQPVNKETLAGTWIMQSAADVEPAEEENLIMLTVLDDGRFLFGTQSNDATCAELGYPNEMDDELGNGVEAGTLEFPMGLVKANATIDTNGECGLYDAQKDFQQLYMLALTPERDAFVFWANDEEDPSGLVFKRAPNEADSIIGAWLWEEGDEFTVAAYLPGGVMFETSGFTGETGILRESFVIEGSQIVSTTNHEHCVDTVNDVDSCLPPGMEITETFSVDGDTMTYEEDTLTRIPAL
jgi:hypothetical protein